MILSHILFIKTLNQNPDSCASKSPSMSDSFKDSHCIILIGNINENIYHYNATLKQTLIIISHISGAVFQEYRKIVMNNLFTKNQPVTSRFVSLHLPKSLQHKCL